MNKLALFAFVKNEVDIIESFLSHHINMFDDITIIDNGSTDGTIDIIKKYDVTLIRDNSSFNEKGKICTDIMNQNNCDILFPLDADEKIIYDDNELKTKNQSFIRSYLQNLEITGAKYKINRIYEYHPDNDGWYDLTKHRKIVFPKKSFMYTDGGFHRGRTTLDNPQTFSHSLYWRKRFAIHDNCIPIKISYMHYHFRSKDIWIKNTEAKLIQRLGDNFLEKLHDYNGCSIHLKRQYLRYIRYNKWHNLKKRFFIDNSML